MGSHQKIQVLLKAALVLTSHFLCVQAVAQSGPNRAPAQAAAAGGAARLIGEVEITSNYMEKGLTQSEAGPSLHAGFGYQFTSGRIGLWGSSVKYLNEDAQTNLRPYISFGFQFTPNSRLDFKYAADKYFKAADRDSNVITLDFDMYSYHAILEEDSNFEGTGTKSMWFGFAHEYKIGSYGIDLRAGYSQLSVAGFNNYFDVKAELKYKWDELAFGLGATFNSEASQFGDAGAPAVFVRMLAVF
jgi:uncharacterized protein (TIGR02001 family)